MATADLKRGSSVGIQFSINGRVQKVDPLTPNVDTETMLADYIRNVAHLKGTKLVCREGGCGACLVSVTVPDSKNGGSKIIKSINSCVTPVYACDGWEITTVEGLGSQSKGCSKIQSQLVGFHGTQCGYCTPGMVMNMHSLVGAKGDNLTMQDIEDHFDGNICRCTGYRPILDAFKSLACDATPELKKKCADIEDCASCPCPMRQGQTFGISSVGSSCQEKKGNKTIQLANGSEWVTAVDMGMVFQTIQRFSRDGKKWRFVAGNTGTGVYKNDGPFDAYVEINGVPELSQKLVESGSNQVIMGGCVTLTETIEFLAKCSSENGFKYLSQISDHIKRVANTPVRNNGTIAGNLMIKYNHREFPSDIFLLLETVGATLEIAEGVGSTTKMSMLQFLSSDMSRKLILSVTFPSLSDGEYKLRTFKITRRYQNAHAYVNAGFLLRIDNKSKSLSLLQAPRIVLGGISPTFFHAADTEAFLGKNKTIDNKTLQGAMEVLEKEVNPDHVLPEAHPSYRKGLAGSLLYKTILGLMSEKTSPKLKSGGEDIPRELRTGKQVVDDEKSDSILYKGVPKVESLSQVTGEADYLPDIPSRPDELFGAFVQSTIGNGTVKLIDTSKALAIPGVVQFISAKDIKGKNDFMHFHFIPTSVQEPIFVENKVSYYGQALGVIVAKDRKTANEAAKKVRVEYENIEKVNVDSYEVYKNAEKDGSLEKLVVGTYKSQPNKSVKIEHTISGEWQTGGQHHFHLEPQNCLCIPTADGLDIISSTQWMDHVQNILSDALMLPANKINIQVKRLGGGFGGKLTRSTQIAAACAISAHTIGKPVRIELDLETNLSLVGRRPPYVITYEVGFDSAGRIGKLNTSYFCDVGFCPNDLTSLYAAEHIQNVYKAVGWEVKAGFLMTNTASCTTMRAPGSFQGVSLIEHVMEHIAHALKKDALAVREANLMEKDDLLMPIFFPEAPLDTENLMPVLIKELKSSGDYDKRKLAVEKYNNDNRWKKRGLAVVAARYPFNFILGKLINATVTIFHYDGTVACSHGGIEMGQGLNTKVAQTIAQAFRIPLDKVKIKPSTNLNGANAVGSGGSQTSELTCYAALKACEILKERLKPIMEKLENPTWESLISEAHKDDISLIANYQPSKRDDVKNYHAWLLASSEVEIDVLTGDYKVVRTDLIEDAGKSLSPSIDIGQIEGGYIQGQGFWTTEKIVHCPETGELLTKRTWDYKPPEPKDIPEDLRITLLKNAPNPHGILRSKAVGEPAVICGGVVYFALRNAIAAARKEKGHEEWFRLDGPVTPEDVHRLCLTSFSDFSLD